MAVVGGLVAVLAAAPGAAAHVSPRLDADAIGRAHAAEHAAQRQALRRWARMPAAERERRSLARRRAAVAFAESTALPGPSVVGAWSAPAPLPGYAIHTALLPTGKILYWDRPPITAAGRANTSRAYLWDPSTPAVAPKDVSPSPFDFDHDGTVDPSVPIFCSGQSLLPTGEVFAAGGTLALGNGTSTYKGARFALTFDPWSETWTRQPDMRHGRWYPGQGQLADGRIVVVSGLDETGAQPGAMNVDLDVFTPSPLRGGRGSWTRYEASHIDWDDDPGEATPGFYPHLITLPSGKLLLLGPMQEDAALLDPARVASGTSAWTQLPDLAQYHPTGNAVLLPGTPAGSWRAAIVGGHFNKVSIPTAETGDLSRPAPFSWLRADGPVAAPDRLPGLNVPRSNANLVLLPDGGLVTMGGAAGISGAAGQNFVGDPPDDRLRQVELYHPGDTAWELGPAQQKFRAYHSTALLLPDGRVLSAGDDYWSPVNDPDPTLGEDIAELYSPPYLFAGTPRPRIEAAPGTLGWGQAFRVAVTGRQAVRAVLMAPGAVTHGNDMNQRHVELEVARGDATGLELRSPPSPAVAPPGWYMLFVLDAAGTPSVAKWVQMKAPATRTPATRTPDTSTPAPTPASPPDRTPPSLHASLAAPVRIGRPARLRVRLNEAGALRVDARAGRRHTRRFREPAAGRPARMRIRLPARRRVRVTIRLRATDRAGNRTYRQIRRTLRAGR